MTQSVPSRAVASGGAVGLDARNHAREALLATGSVLGLGVRAQDPGLLQARQVLYWCWRRGKASPGPQHCYLAFD